MPDYVSYMGTWATCITQGDIQLLRYHKMSKIWNPSPPPFSRLFNFPFSLYSLTREQMELNFTSIIMDNMTGRVSVILNHQDFCFGLSGYYEICKPCKRALKILPKWLLIRDLLGWNLKKGGLLSSDFKYKVCRLVWKKLFCVAIPCSSMKMSCF